MVLTFVVQTVATDSMQINSTDIIGRFTDPVFRAAILAEIGKTAGPVYESDVMDIGDLYLYYNGISAIRSLNGIEYLKSLTDLYIEGHQLTTIDVSKNENLISLEIIKSSLTAIDVSENLKLKKLDLDHNLLTTIDVSDNIELTYLSVASNSLTTIDVSNNPLLNNLYVNDNQLTEIDISNNGLLWKFNCSNNLIKSTSEVTGWQSIDELVLGVTFIFDPQRLPGVPQNFVVTYGDRSARLSWAAPANNGRAAITRYEVSMNNGATWVTASSNTGHTFSGLTNGATLTFAVRAVNVAGAGAQASLPVRLPADEIERLVARLYLDVLGRTHDASGLSHWSSLIKSGRTGASVAHNFFFSAEFLRRQVSNVDYIDILYRALMGREPDPSGRTHWLGKLNNPGMPREVLFADFVNSREFGDLCRQAGIERGTYTAPPGGWTRVFVTRLYKEVLGRDPDTSGLNHWTNEILSGRRTGASAAHAFIFSNERAQHLLNNGQYIDLLYKTMMGRVPDAAGRNHWVNRLNSGWTRAEVFNAFVISVEFTNLCREYEIVRGNAP